MTSYPFDRVWHHGRGIVFADKGAAQIAAQLEIQRIMHSAAADGAQEDEVTYRSIEEDSNEDAESFTTAPEQSDDLPVEGDELADPIVEDAETAQAIVDEIQLPVLAAPIPPLTKLEYKVCKDAYLAAQAAEEGSEESFWTYKLYRGPVNEDGKETNVTVHYCTSKETMERVCQLFLNEKVLGFDMEWHPSATKKSSAKDNCSLLQIASPSRIGLFHVGVFPTTEEDVLVTPTFKQIMENPEVRKAGVNIKGDCTRLRMYTGVDTKGAFELSHLYRLVRYSPTRADLVNKRLVALGTQVKDCLGLPMFKGMSVRTSNWAKRLNMKQIYYSASDAYAGLQVYHVLDEMRQAMKPTPPMPHHLELNLPIRLAEQPAPEDEKQETIDGEDEAADADVAVETKNFPGYPALNPAGDETIIREPEAPGPNDDMSKK